MQKMLILLLRINKGIYNYGMEREEHIYEKIMEKSIGSFDGDDACNRNASGNGRSGNEEQKETGCVSQHYEAGHKDVGFEKRKNLHIKNKGNGEE